MSVTNYTTLQSEAIAYSGRGDLTARLPTFVQLCESDMQIRLKTVDFESEANVTVTAGSGTLPSDFSGARAVKWDGDEDRDLSYITPSRYNALAASYTSGTPNWHTVIGTTLKTLPPGTGTAVIDYQARFTALSDSNLTNAIITKYPDAYFAGTMKQLYLYTRNTVEAQKWGDQFERAVARIITDHKDRKYPGPLEVRPR